MTKMKTLRNLLLAGFVLIAFSLSAQWNTSGANIYNTNTGFVGIGTSSPTNLLHAAKNMTGAQVKFEPSMLTVVSEVAAMAKSGDVIITLGAGDVSSLGEPILQALSSR